LCANEKVINALGVKDHWFTFHGDIITCHKEGETPLNIDLSEDLIGFLTHDITDNGNPNALDNFKRILMFALGHELNILFHKTGKIPGKTKIIELMRKNNKFLSMYKELFKVTKGLGFKEISYKDLAKRRIMIAPNPPEQVKRLLVLLGAKKSGIENEDADNEFGALLDTLWKEKIIDKQFYKILYYKYKQKLVNY